MIPNELRSAWFCEWNESAQFFDFISVETNVGDSFRDRIAEKVILRLGLQSRDVLVANMAQINTEYIGSLPDHPHPQHIAVAFFMVHLYSQSSKPVVNSIPDARWLTASELLASKAKDCRAVSPTLSHLLTRTEVIQAW